MKSSEIQNEIMNKIVPNQQTFLIKEFFNI